MAVAVGAIVLGLVLLAVGGELLVRGASSLAFLARVTPTVVGLTIVAAGTSMPELVVSVQASLEGSPALAVGNVVGSNIFNVGAIVGLAALIAPLTIQGNTVRLEWPVMMLAAFELHLLARDGVVDRLEGGFLFAALVAFITYAVWIARRNANPGEVKQYEEGGPRPMGGSGGRAWLLSLAAVAAGVAVMVGGSTALVRGAVFVARTAGVSETVIGLTVVAAGTSLPELAASLVAAVRGRQDIAVANVIGSNIFNALGIVGSAALIRPLAVPAEVLARDSLWMLGFSAVLFPLMRTGMRITRLEGALLLAGFALYMALLLLRGG